MTDNMQRAREPKFGDWIRGIYASERNPIRDGIYVRTTRRNHETLYELTDGKGKFWMYPKRSTERLDRPNAFDAAALRLTVPEGFVVVPREPTDEVIHHMAASLDHPSVFMGGPSERSKRAAAQAYRAMLAAAPTVSAEGEKIVSCRCFTQSDKELCLHKRECSVVTAHSDEETP